MDFLEKETENGKKYGAMFFYWIKGHIQNSADLDKNKKGPKSQLGRAPSPSFIIVTGPQVVYLPYYNIKGFLGVEGIKITS